MSRKTLFPSKCAVATGGAPATQQESYYRGWSVTNYPVKVIESCEIERKKKKRSVSAHNARIWSLPFNISIQITNPHLSLGKIASFKKKLNTHSIIVKISLKFGFRSAPVVFLDKVSSNALRVFCVGITSLLSTCIGKKKKINTPSWHIFVRPLCALWLYDMRPY